MSPRWSLWLAAPLPAIAIGCLVATRDGISPKAFLPNVLGVILGAPLAVFGISRLGSLTKRHPASTAFLLLLLFASSLLFPGVDNVRRWIPLGPLRLNISMVLAPLALFTLSVALEKGTSLAAITIMAVLAVHILQPDAGQAIAFAAGACALFVLATGLSRLLGILTAIGIVVVTMLRPDPLAAVPQVERILHLAIGAGALATIATLLAIVALFAPFVWAAQRQDKQRLAISFAVYLIAAFAVTEVGNFPVPVVGAGASAVIGWYLMTGFAVQERYPPR